MKYYRSENKKNKVFFFYAFLTGLFLSSPVFSQIKVVTTTSDLSSIAKFIGGDCVKVYSFSTGSQNPLYIEPVPRFYWKLQSADLFVTAGVDLEKKWVSEILNKTQNKKIQKGGDGYVDASTNISIIETPSKMDLGKNIQLTNGNPFYWLDPENGKTIALNIYNGLIRIDPKDQKIYETNLNRFNETLDTKMNEWLIKANSLGDTKFISINNEWQYFARRFNVKLLNGFGIESSINPTQQLELLAQEMKSDSIQIILQPLFDSSHAESKLAHNVHGKIVTLASSVWANKEIKTYFDLFDYNINQLLAALQNTNM